MELNLLRRLREYDSIFPGDQYSTEMNISILDDDVAEPKEMFYLHFEIPEGLEPKIKLLNNQVPVVIEDDESTCRLWKGT